MKRFLVAAAVVAIWGIPAMGEAAHARPGGYFSGFLGVNIPRDAEITGPGLADQVEFDPSVAVGGTAGYDYGFFRLEGEISYRHAGIGGVYDTLSAVRYRGVDGDVGALAFMANAYFDMENDTPVTPYWGGGIGFAVLNIGDTTGIAPDGRLTDLYYNGNDTVFAYQAGAGVEIALNPFLSLDLGYRYFGTSTATVDKDSPLATRFKLESHNALMGLRVKF